MKNLKKLMLSMSHDAYCSSEKLLNTIDVLNTINKQKSLICKTNTTETIEGVPAHVLEIMSKSFELPILFPSKECKHFRISIKFSWGTILLIQQEAHN